MGFFDAFILGRIFCTKSFKEVLGIRKKKLSSLFVNTN
ncbi:hypothetical protein SGRA_4166 [Saprospira grandis str. Lewin]|uniref:Uncharacterized protein n=1 Tax=Saprospira grandis (strain Lewin) TaxID=984262 RepID=H6L8S5_SAPGL|nr:hypothetical protein SGRA_4166 [Saprospira grandis str. Lewin]